MERLASNSASSALSTHWSRPLPLLTMSEATGKSPLSLVEATDPECDKYSNTHRNYWVGNTQKGRGLLRFESCENAYVRDWMGLSCRVLCLSLDDTGEVECREPREYCGTSKRCGDTVLVTQASGAP